MKKTQTHSKINFCSLDIDNLSMEETISLIDSTIQSNQDITLTDVNAGKIIQIQEDSELKHCVIHSDIIQADGQAVIWASKILGKPLKERVAGIDLVESLIKLSYDKGYKIFFFGAQEEVVQKAITRFTSRYNENIIAGYRNGYFKMEDSAQIAENIANSGAHILFVAITSPLQEQFLYYNRDILKSVSFKMGVGGSFDVFAGKTKRAPLWMQKIGMEWFYRFLQEPKRMWKRYLIGNTKFLFLVLKEKFRKNHSL